MSTFIPAGAIHNDQPLTVTDDSWTSYEMRFTLLKLHHDPFKAGDETMELVNVVRGEPDPTRPSFNRRRISGFVIWTKRDTRGSSHK